MSVGNLFDLGPKPYQDLNVNNVICDTLTANTIIDESFPLNDSTIFNYRDYPEVSTTSGDFQIGLDTTHIFTVPGIYECTLQCQYGNTDLAGGGGVGLNYGYSPAQWPNKVITSSRQLFASNYEHVSDTEIITITEQDLNTPRSFQILYRRLQTGTFRVRYQKLLVKLIKPL